MKEKIKKNKGFIQVILLIVTLMIFAGMIVLSLVIAINGYSKGIYSLLANISAAFRK